MEFMRGVIFLDKSFHYLLMANQAMLHKRLLNGLKSTSLTIGQPKILDYLKDNNGASQKEIAISCHIEAPSLTSILNRMEEKNLIVRKSLNGNRRTIYVFLTDFGVEMQKEVEKMFSLLEDMAFEGISKEEREIFLDVFLKIYNNLKSEKGEH